MRVLIVTLVVLATILTAVGMVLLMFPQVKQGRDGGIYVEVLDGDLSDLWKKPILGTGFSVLGSLLNSVASYSD
ncbi:MAG: hypothetical protein WAS54_07325 [Scrofimicrobium sp.]